MSGDAKKGSFIETLMRFLNLFTVIALLLSYSSSRISPTDFWPLAFAGMAYPIILGIMAFLVVYWLLKRNRLFFLNLGLIILNWNFVSATVQFNKNVESLSEYDPIRVMTYNVRLFDYYRWAEDGNTRTKSFDFIYKQQPNILCIQELYIDRNDNFRIMDTLLQTNSIKHAHIENYRDDQKPGRIWGMATFSSYPIINKGVIDFTSTFGNRCLYSDMIIDSDTVRVYNTHFQSVRIGEDQYLFLDQLMMNKSMKGVPLKSLLGDMKLLIYRMVHGFVERGKQADQVAEHAKQSPYPVIICGDFNDTPTSYAYQRFAKDFIDSFQELGRGFATTYVRIPFFRIDNIFYSDDFEALQHYVHPEVLSDHYAVSAAIKKK